MTEDVLRFAAARAIGEAGSGSASLHLERPHPSLPGSRVDLAIGEPPEAVIELNYPGEQHETNASWTWVLGEILTDFYRLAVYPGEVDRIVVLALTRRARESLSSSVGRFGIDLDNDHVSLNAEAAAALPHTEGVISDELRDHPVVASRLWALDVDEDLRISVFLVDAVAGPSNSLVAFAVMPRSDRLPLPRSGPTPRAADGALVASSKAQNATQGNEHLSIWYQLAKCVTQLDEPFRRSEIIGWFRRHYPETKESSLPRTFSPRRRTEGMQPGSSHRASHCS